MGTQGLLSSQNAVHFDSWDIMCLWNRPSVLLPGSPAFTSTTSTPTTSTTTTSTTTSIPFSLAIPILM